MESLMRLWEYEVVSKVREGEGTPKMKPGNTVTIRKHLEE